MQKTADCGLSTRATVPGLPADLPSGVHQHAWRHNFAKILLVMRLTTLLLTLALAQTHATGVAQNISLSGSNLPLKQVFDNIEKQTGYVFFSTKGTLTDTRPVTFTVRDMPLRDFLNMVLKDQSLGYVISGKTIHLARKVEAHILYRDSPDSAKYMFFKQVITGRVTDSSGIPLVGATIGIRGKASVTTDANGRF